MTKSKTPTREALLSQLEALDNSTEINRLKADLDRMTEERDSLLAQRRENEKTIKTLEDSLGVIREALRVSDRRNVSRYGTAENAALMEASAAARRKELVEVRIGIAKGTHDAVTGLPFNKENPKPMNYAETTKPISKTDLNRAFPELAGPDVEVSTEEAEAAD